MGNDRIDRTITALIAEQAGRAPDAVAVVCDDRTLTYRDLHTRAKRLAGALRSRGIGPNVVVGLCMDRSVDMIAAILGVLHSRGAYLPLDPTAPRERLGDQLRGARAALVIADRQTKANASVAAEIEAISFDELEASGVPAADATEVDPSVPDDLAYVIGTSGSTGKPKLVAVTQRNLVHSTDSRLRYYEDVVSRFLLLSPIHFDSSVAGIFWTLCQGGTLEIVPPSSHLDIAAIARLIQERRVSHLLALPALYRELLACGDAVQLASLRTAVVAGEVCPPRLIDDHFRRVPAAKLFNEYGPTEASVWCSVFACRPEDAGASVPIGSPIQNTEIFVLDERQVPVPVGVAGMIYVAGAGLSAGYLNDPAATERAFPYLPSIDRRVYGTGDRGRFRADGNLEFLGRADQQIKIRGRRVELGEIEALLLRDSAVTEAVVLAEEAPSGRPSLIAYVAAAPDQPARLDARLEALLAERLPTYACPDAVRVLGVLPRLANGKVDRARLLAAAPRSRSASTPDWTALESRLAQLWKDILRVDVISPGDDFFDMGGDSILLMRAHTALQKMLGVEVDIVTLFEHSTIGKLAAALEPVIAASSADLPRAEA